MVVSRPIFAIVLLLGLVQEARAQQYYCPQGPDPWTNGGAAPAGKPAARRAKMRKALKQPTAADIWYPIRSYYGMSCTVHAEKTLVKGDILYRITSADFGPVFVPFAPECPEQPQPEPWTGKANLPWGPVTETTAAWTQTFPLDDRVFKIDAFGLARSFGYSSQTYSTVDVSFTDVATGVFSEAGGQYGDTNVRLRADVPESPGLGSQGVHYTFDANCVSQ